MMLLLLEVLLAWFAVSCIVSLILGQLMKHNTEADMAEILKFPQWCDACGERLLEPPIVTRNLASGVVRFDTFRCFEIHNDALVRRARLEREAQEAIV